jgi:NAD(P)-dependent dehydrogenase (short-subunit alcohol dehydrogenase family)
MEARSERQIALVTGANRGIGLEVCRQLAKLGYTVLLGSRDIRKGEVAARKVGQRGLNILPRQLDVTDPQSIDALKSEVESDFKVLHALINNAGILYDTWQRALNADFKVVREAFDTNTLGAWRMCNAFIPALRASGHGRIVNVSSEAGSLHSIGGGTPAYSLSKAAMNVVTRLLSDELRGSGILVNSVCPGWVATDMGGAGGRAVEEGAAGIVWAATLPDSGPTGGFFRDGKPLRW